MHHTWRDAPQLGRISVHCSTDGEALQVGGGEISRNRPSTYTEFFMSNLIDVAVVYNGVTKTIKVNLNEAVQAVLQHALNEFGVQQNRDNFGLFNANGQELNTSSSAQDAGVTATSQLLLRPRQVRGGV